MPIPSFNEFKLPVLRTFANGNEHTTKDLLPAIQKHFNLSEQDMKEMIPSLRQTRVANRIYWSYADLCRAGLLQKIKPGWYKITDEGKQLLTENPPPLTRVFLSQRSPVFAEWLKRSSAPNTVPNADMPDTVDTQTPEERLKDAFEEIHGSLVDEVLEKLQTVNPYQFEQIVLDVLVAMGYGGSRAEAARVTQRSGDEGIDGIINEDRLGLDTIYIQAKRWQHAVGRRELQAFVGALSGQGANKGIFITSGTFAKTAYDYLAKIQQRVIPIDGEKLAGLMVEHGVGVSVEKTYTLKRLDSDYFEPA